MQKVNGGIPASNLVFSFYPLRMLLLTTSCDCFQAFPASVHARACLCVLCIFFLFIIFWRESVYREEAGGEGESIFKQAPGLARSPDAGLDFIMGRYDLSRNQESDP